MDGLHISHLSFIYPKVESGSMAFQIRNVTFPCTFGGITCLVGPSGSGKSTILKLISGLLIPKSGFVLLGHDDLLKSQLGSRGTATVYQDFALLPYLTVYENIMLGPTIARKMTAETHKDVLNFSELFGLTDFLNRSASTLSGGERQRVAILRALAAKPRVLLMDEPTASLDMISKDQLASTLLSLKRAAIKIVILIVTHDRDFALRVADSLAVIDQGTIVWHGATTRLFSDPTDARVYEILGTSVFLSGTVADGRFRIKGQQFSDWEIGIDGIPGANSGDISIGAPRTCVTLFPPASDGEDRGAGAIAIRGTIKDRSIAANGAFQYDVELPGGATWNGLFASPSYTDTHLEIGADVEARIPRACLRAFARIREEACNG